MSIYNYSDLSRMDVNAIKNPMLMTPKNATYKLLRHTGMMAIVKWAEENNLKAEVSLAMKIIAIQIKSEYMEIKKAEDLIGEKCI